jgi:hypothetical protein
MTRAQYEASNGFAASFLPARAQGAADHEPTTVAQDTAVLWRNSLCFGVHKLYIDARRATAAGLSSNAAHVQLFNEFAVSPFFEQYGTSTARPADEHGFEPLFHHHSPAGGVTLPARPDTCSIAFGGYPGARSRARLH